MGCRSLAQQAFSVSWTVSVTELQLYRYDTGITCVASPSSSLPHLPFSETGSHYVNLAGLELA